MIDTDTVNEVQQIQHERDELVDRRDRLTAELHQTTEQIHTLNRRQQQTEEMTK